MKDLLLKIIMAPVALLLALLVYLDWYVFGNLPERKF